MTREIPLTKGYVAIIDDADRDLVAGLSWRAHLTGARICADRRVSRDGNKRELMHRVIMSAPDGVEVDHVNGDALDNRRCNLRFATRSQNIANVRKRRGLSSRYKGVTWHRQVGKWQAKIVAEQRSYYLGLFIDETEAAKTYDAKAVEFFGEFARVNFPIALERAHPNPLAAESKQFNAMESR